MATVAGVYRQGSTAAGVRRHPCMCSLSVGLVHASGDWAYHSQRESLMLADPGCSDRKRPCWHLSFSSFHFRARWLESVEFLTVSKKMTRQPLICPPRSHPPPPPPTQPTQSLQDHGHRCRRLCFAGTLRASKLFDPVLRPSDWPGERSVRQSEESKPAETAAPGLLVQGGTPT